MPLLKFTKEGIYCEKANVYIDPWRPVGKAFLTHGHADHARYGSQEYLCSNLALPVIKHRLGNINISGIDYGEEILVNGVKFSFHPAGHVIGSAQIRVEHKGEIWVVSGDYKVENDNLSTPFEPINCQHFVTESTFALPVYQWKPQQEVMNEINDWWLKCKNDNKIALLTAYSLGKAQRIIQNVNHRIGKIFTHGAIESINQVIRAQGIKLIQTELITKETTKAQLKGALVICPPSAVDSPWAKKLKPYSVGVASGWMALRGQRRRRAADRGFVLSDHADWQGLLEAIDATGAQNIYVTHGYSDIFSRYLREEKGLNAKVLETEFNTESEE
ncbi:MAG: ligase-associated DNA damage response exonuclease [Bacteroidia bacterium]